MCDVPMYQRAAAVGCVGLAALTFCALHWHAAPDPPAPAPPPAAPAAATLSGLPPPCRARLRDFDTRRCTRRGDIGPTGEVQSCPTETEDVACVVLGRKPVALLHTTKSEVCGAAAATVLDSSLGPVEGVAEEAGTLVEDCAVPTLTDPHRRRRATVVFTPATQAQAAAAPPLLRRIGAWDAEPGPAADVSELQAHIALGAILGYRLEDLRGQAKSLGGEAHFVEDCRAAFAQLPPDLRAEYEGLLARDTEARRW